jgi:hypothetical protein
MTAIKLAAIALATASLTKFAMISRERGGRATALHSRLSKTTAASR